MSAPTLLMRRNGEQSRSVYVPLVHEDSSPHRIDEAISHRSRFGQKSIVLTSIRCHACRLSEDLNFQLGLARDVSEVSFSTGSKWA